MGYSRTGSLSLFRAITPQTFSGSASAGSTCWPSSGLFCNHGESTPLRPYLFLAYLKLLLNLVGNLIHV